MKVFLSWSGARAHAVASALYNWSPDVVNAIVPWMSSEDIESGARWSSTIAQGLVEAEYGIICVTPENIERPWVLFEAGALAKALDARVTPYMLGFPNLSLETPPSPSFRRSGRRRRTRAG